MTRQEDSIAIEKRVQKDRTSTRARANRLARTSRSGDAARAPDAKVLALGAKGVGLPEGGQGRDNVAAERAARLAKIQREDSTRCLFDEIDQDH